MTREKLGAMPFSKVYPLLVNKAVRKGRAQAEVDAAICWLTGYDGPGLRAQLARDASYEDFFSEAPRIHPDADALVTGRVCGVRVEEIEDPFLRRVRQLDKLVDELAKGRPLDRVLRQA